MRQRFIQSFPTSQDIQSALDNKELGKPYVAFPGKNRVLTGIPNGWTIENAEI